MTFKKGIKSLENYIKNEKEFCENPELNHGDQARINEKRLNFLILEDILRDFKINGLELPVSVIADKAGIGRTLMEGAKPGEPFFIESGIELQGRRSLRTASVSAEQVDNFAFIVPFLSGVAAGYIANLLVKLHSTIAKRIRIGNVTIPVDTSLDDIRKVIREELERINKEENSDM